MSFNQQKNTRYTIEIEGETVSVKAKTSPHFLNYKEAFKKCVADGIELALTTIKLRPRTVFEAETNLKHKGFLPQEIEEIILKLKEHKYLDDRLYLRYFLNSYQQHKPYGEYALRQKLSAKGISRELLNEELSAYQEENDPAEEAFELVLKRMGRYEGLPKLDQIKKIDRYLYSRGFQYEVTERVLGLLEKRGYLSEK